MERIVIITLMVMIVIKWVLDKAIVHHLHLRMKIVNFLEYIVIEFVKMKVISFTLILGNLEEKVLLVLPVVFILGPSPIIMQFVMIIIVMKVDSNILQLKERTIFVMGR